MPSKKKKKIGTVYLVGAGPGDPGLLTLRGAKLLGEADAVVYDGLVSPSILSFSARAEKIYAGKYRAQPSKHYVDQKKINQLLVSLAKKGKKVIRLKGGDPFIFGRGGEEALYLKRNGIPFEIVPGVSAGYGVPAYAGIPVTDRDHASLVTFVTAHENLSKSKSSIDWSVLAKLSGTLVVFMGVQNLGPVAANLIQCGKPKRTLVSVIEWGTTARQKTVSGTLEDIAEKVLKAGLHSPALTVVGEVNAFRKSLGWFEKKPLFGKTILLTRASAQARSLKELIEENGADALEFSAIEILPPSDFAPLDKALLQMRDYDWILFTSVNGAQSVFNRIAFLKKDARIFSRTRVAAIGETTRLFLEQKGICPDLMPERYTSEALAAALKKSCLIQGKRFLLPRTDIAPAFLRDFLKKEGGLVTEVTAYRTVSGPKNNQKKQVEDALKRGKIDYITFTSASTVKHFFEAFGKAALRRIKSRLVSIGPVTSDAIRSYGYRPYREAKEHTIPGIIEVLKND